jgi:hypothetical protein
VEHHCADSCWAKAQQESVLTFFFSALRLVAVLKVSGNFNRWLFDLLKVEGPAGPNRDCLGNPKSCWEVTWHCPLGFRSPLPTNAKPMQNSFIIFLELEPASNFWDVRFARSSGEEPLTSESIGSTCQLNPLGMGRKTRLERDPFVY